MISILVTGISGRMGQAIQEAVTQNPDTCVGSTHDQGQELYPALAKCDVAIDFSHHAFTSTLLAEAVANNKPLVIGTTGHTELERQGYIYSVKGRGSFVADNRQIRERKRQEIWDQLELLIRDAKGTGITMLEFQEQVIQSYGSEKGGNRNDKG